jgi:hypothetical protein
MAVVSRERGHPKIVEFGEDIRVECGETWWAKSWWANLGGQNPGTGLIILPMIILPNSDTHPWSTNE